MKFNVIARGSVLASLLALLASSASAHTFKLGGVLSGTGPDLPDIIKLSARDSGEDVKFDLSVPGLEALGPNAFIGAIAVDGIQMGELVDVKGGAPIAFAEGKGPGGDFDFRFDLTGPKQDRLVDGESMQWTWRNAHQGLHREPGLDFAIHVQGVDTSLGHSSSLWYGVSAVPAAMPSVPEPETAALALVGLLMMGVKMRRRA